MPLLGTRGAASSRAFGLLSVANIGGPYWIGRATGAVQTSTAVDYDGNMYWFTYTGANAVIVKYNAVGALQWQKTWTAPPISVSWNAFNIFLGFEVDNNRNLYFTSITTNTGNGNYGYAIVKLDASGAIVYNKFITDVDLYPGGITIDRATGDLYVVGQKDPNPGVTLPQGIVTKFNASGVEQFSIETDDAPQSLFLKGVAIDSAKNIYVGGFGGHYVAKYSSSGVQQWQKKLSGYGQINSISIDQSGNIYAVGFSNTPTNNSRILKADSSGNLQWQRTLTGANSYSYSSAVDSFGNVYTLGSGASQIQLTKYNSSGSIVWQRSLDQGGAGYSLKIDRSNNLYLGASGWFAKLPSDGSLTGTYTVGGTSVTYAASSLTNTTTTDSWGTASTTDTSVTMTSNNLTGTVGTGSLTLNLTTL